MIRTDNGNDHPVTTCTITAVARNRIPSANTRVTRKIPEATFCIVVPYFSPKIS